MDRKSPDSSALSYVLVIRDLCNCVTQTSNMNYKQTLKRVTTLNKVICLYLLYKMYFRSKKYLILKNLFSAASSCSVPAG